MAIPVVQLVMSLRYALGDMQGLNISDYELIEPINQAASKLYGRLSERFVHEAVAEKVVVVGTDNEEGHFLPSSFNRIYQVLGSTELATVQKKDDGTEEIINLPSDDDYKVIIPTSGRKPVFGAYRIIGRTFKAAKGTYIIEYYYVPAKVEQLGKDLDVPESMRTWIEQLALAYYRKDYATAETIMQQCESVLAGREVSHFENTNPAQTLGARG
ncbi:MAG: hypothetical protein IJM68_00565 [Synergistaceae bacterium]|nr:hypothetical protein [Synergistaceae bacterium]